ncbi:CIR protein [Plasmodium chabaudi chabaudi]|uniref:CIR protein n=1 Tax=Plasmodium chabaudi chabaudi TaxID=31271 RepID=A0A4V0K1R1_PLACU|nr:CIR protein [Plasmodium chabaudi chabaudi]VTZ66765.1 CIR protein [Plasmodium chabaudi chabaudi]|eukprot:XP_016652929.1 CIR protein [Plasmodium chabaudi chabaudi]
MLEEVCGTIKKIDDCLSRDILSTGDKCSDAELYTVYCSTKKEGVIGKCETNGGRISAGFIWLLVMFDVLCGGECSEKDQYDEYAILWLSSKYNLISPEYDVNITGIYDILERNNPIWYNKYRDRIGKKRNVMDFGDFHMGNLYNLLKEMCILITKYNEDRSYQDVYLKYANNCANIYKNLVTNVPKGKVCDSYCEVLSTLKNGYDKFREEKNESTPNFQLPKFIEDGVETCKSLCKSNDQKLEAENLIAEESEIFTTHQTSLPDLSTTELRITQEEPQSNIESQRDGLKSITLQSVTPISINNGSKLPYIAVPFILIPIIFAISYKYLTLMWKKKMKSKKNARKIINLRDKK